MNRIEKLLIYVSLFACLYNSLTLANDYPISQIQKRLYFGKKAWCIRTDREGLLQLKEKYHKFKIPELIHRWINFDTQFPDIILYNKYPKTMGWTNDGTFIFKLNYPFLTQEYMAALPDLSKLKNLDDGLSIVGFYFHPNVVKNSKFLNRNLPAKPYLANLTFEEVETKSEPYLVTILDLNPSHVPFLKKIKEVGYELLKNYGVTAKDQVKMYFHSLYAPSLSSLHLHIRVNQGVPGLEYARIHPLDEVISHLEKGLSMVDLLEKKIKENNGCMFANAHFNKNDPNCSLPKDADNAACYLPHELQLGLQNLGGLPSVKFELIDNPFLAKTKL